MTRSNLAAMLDNAGQYAAAEKEHRAVLAIRGHPAPRHAQTG